MTESHETNGSCKVRFEHLEAALQEAKSSTVKSIDVMQDIREAIVKLTLIQENQQVSITNQQDALRDQQQALQDQADAQNKMLEQLMALEKERSTREASFYKNNITKNEMSTKKVIAITGVISTLITSIGAIITSIILKA